MITLANISSMIDHSILHPTLTDNDLMKHCKIAVKYEVATVCVKPYHVIQAMNFIKGSNVGVCAVVGFPHGNSTTEVKVYETLQVCKDGANEVDMVVNIGKVLQGDWEYVSAEIKSVHDACLKNSAILKVIFETDFVTNDIDKIKLCQICSEHKVEFVKTSTGYGFVKGSDGKYFYLGATEHDLKLLRQYCSPSVKIKAAGGVRTLDQLLKARECGADRVGASATEEIMKEAIKRYTV
jgi:deoxyribose-phosphate aldolase